MSNNRAVRIAVVLGACVALAACAGAPVDERPVVRIVEAAQPSPAIPLGRFLPSAQELSATLGTGPHGFLGQLVEGDADMLLRTVGDAQATPHDCVGTAYRLQKIVYDATPVRSVASSSWAGGEFDGPPVSGFFGVVQMESTADADEFFAATTDDWRRCNGQTVVLQQPGLGADEVSRISDVGFDRRVVSASVLHASAGSASAPGMRALGVVGDCIVDVELSDPRAGGGASPAIGVAKLILDKIAAQR
ncbi:sensor domain-containing protein [Mycolicibacterium pyrenivorans]|uniref:sensor domain-containing protein n=1 Tax=Mycolicibacterium pyrenivorans TaxID=187102 RepID=UPI0021F2AC53|nr:sensor domain-containing protein [Mycolicibacterium pyrenivorans]MCV7154505.1 sensor domain-containing protein [Mycolicibacterium pyrenivorans]